MFENVAVNIIAHLSAHSHVPLSDLLAITLAGHALIECSRHLVYGDMSVVMVIRPLYSTLLFT